MEGHCDFCGKELEGWHSINNPGTCLCIRYNTSPYEEMWAMGLWCSGCHYPTESICRCRNVSLLTRCSECHQKLSHKEFSGQTGKCKDCNHKPRATWGF